MNLQELKASILEDGKIDAQEALQVRELIFADGVVDKEEVDFLFEVNDAVSDADNSSDWTDLMVDAVSSHVLEDEATPGVVDQAEGDYIYDKIAGDGALDSTESAILVNLKQKATEIQSEKLNGLISLLEDHTSTETTETSSTETSTEA